MLLEIFQLAAAPPSPSSESASSPTADRNATLRNLSLVCKTFRLVAQTVLFSDLQTKWTGATVERLLGVLEDSPGLARLVTRVQATHYPALGESSSIRAAILEQVRLGAVAGIDQRVDAIWGGEKQDSLHGSINALLKLASLAPRLRVPVLDDFTVTLTKSIQSLPRGHFVAL